MKLNLDELERRAKSAGGQEWTLTIDATGDAFLSAENSEYVAEVGAVGEDGIVSDYGKFIAAANPAVVLELVRRLREAEARVAELEAELSDDHWPHGATVKLRWVGSGYCEKHGRAKRSAKGQLITVCSGVRLDESKWEVVQERKVQPAKNGD